MRRIMGLVVLLAGLSAVPAFATEPAQERWASAGAEGYRLLQRDSAQLQVSATAYCDAPSDARREQVERHWHAAFGRWQAVRFIDFGPLLVDSRGWQLQFWPDNKNLVGSQTERLLQHSGDQPPSLNSVAVQGFPALEFLLFDPQLQTRSEALPSVGSCRVLKAVAERLADNASQLQADWQAYAQRYREDPEAEAKMLLAALHALEQLRDKRLGQPMGMPAGRRNVYLAEAWRSQSSLQAAQASLQGLQTYFLPGLEMQLQGAAQQRLAVRFAELLQSALVRFETLPPGMATVLEDQTHYLQLQRLYIDIDGLARLLGGDIAVELGVVRGFNASDGD
ncbi:MAG: peptidase M75, Imelysin [Gammaproteobacteria bacterium HGW-Gammaproteobacteria-11]|nr:MAG: peptidase M75, Imelysin [Gammaproteobacteria bacterium HGW-Gammaproteobacteria-11]